jgi:AraC family transcriptional regulator
MSTSESNLPSAPQPAPPRPSMFSAPGHRDTLWSDLKGTVAQSKEIVWPGGTVAAHRIDKVSGIAAIRTQAVEFQFSWNSGYVEADAQSARRVHGYKNRPRYGLVLPPETEVEFRIGEKSNYGFLSIELEPEYVLRVSELQHLRSLAVAETWDYNHPLTWQLAQAICEECESGARQGLLYGEAAITLLILHIVRHLSNCSPTLRPFRRGGLAPGVLRRTCEYMASRLGDDLSLSEVANIGGLSPGHFSFAFRHSMGIPPYAWLRRRRIEHAKQLLRSPDLTLASVAAAVGYANQSAFGVAFKRETGASPAGWRRVHCS